MITAILCFVVWLSIGFLSSYLRYKYGNWLYMNRLDVLMSTLLGVIALLLFTFELTWWQEIAFQKNKKEK
jgi:formate hydrogenlyase subunit 3/multisubunit Na+/H+ antiporter MnhD subunit